MLPRSLSSACVAASLAFAPFLQAAETATAAPSVKGVPRSDANSRLAHEELLTKARSGRIDLYFVGDSITRRWGTSDAAYRDLHANWQTNFHGWNAGNFGWGADRVENILWRLENGELDGVNPKVIVLLAGTNNLRDEHAEKPEADTETVDQVANGVRAILAVIREKAPQAKVVVIGITPRQTRAGKPAHVATIRAINRRYAALADGTSVRFIDLADRLGDADGKPLEGMTVDGLHLSTKAYQIWADALKPVLTELLGPRAATDQAPPPTGDPSARRK
jgi:lysophospholipase L1-like esterase